MPDDARRISSAAIREAVRLAIEANSLRHVAREVGISPMGLKGFADGREAYSATYQKLRDWYLQYTYDRQGPFRMAAVRTALEVLLEDLPRDRRASASMAVLEVIERLYTGRELPVPGWLKALKDESSGHPEQ